MFKDLFIKKYRNYKIYLHNFAKFDSIFLLKTFSNITNIKPIIHNGNLIQLTITYNNYIITFKDSLLLLPSSLRKLCKSFNLEENKGIFPFKFTNINYIGIIPDYKYFIDVSNEEYNNYCNSFINAKLPWNFKEEAIKYCELVSFAK